MEGIVKWFDLKKNYGFIKGDDGDEYFVHHTAVPQGVTLRENDRVSFEGVDSQRGKQAQNVQVLGKEEAAEPAEEPEGEPEGEEEPAEETPAEEPKEEESEGKAEEEPKEE